MSKTNKTRKENEQKHLLLKILKYIHCYKKGTLLVTLDKFLRRKHENLTKSLYYGKKNNNVNF